MARITNAIQEVATDLKGNLPRLFQETRELRRETQQLTVAYNTAAAEITNVRDLVNANKDETDKRILATEQNAADFKMTDRAEKQEMWNKLCGKNVVQDLADKVRNTGRNNTRRKCKCLGEDVIVGIWLIR